MTSRLAWRIGKSIWYLEIREIYLKWKKLCSILDIDLVMQALPTFLFVTARPEFRSSWGARSHHGTFSLVPLNQDQVWRMIGELAARHARGSDRAHWRCSTVRIRASRRLRN
jgi:hypothetical protein